MRLSWPGQARESDSVDDASPPGIETDRGQPAIADGLDHLQDRPVLEAEPVVGMALRRALIDGYDRVADRVLQRMQATREDIDAELSGLRSEMAALRESIEDVGNRVQLRQLRASIDELRSDVAGLRRAVLEWPELERVSADITAIRAGMADVVVRVEGRDMPAGSPASLAPLIEEIATLRGELPHFEPVATQLAELRAEISMLRRRIALRAVDPSDRGFTSMAPPEPLRARRGRPGRER